MILTGKRRAATAMGVKHEASPSSPKGRKEFVYSSLALALSSASLGVFRGPISIVSALFVPSILAIFLKNSGKAYRMLTYAGMLAIALLFFQTQVIFALGYIMLSIAFKAFQEEAGTRHGNRFARMSAYVAFTAIVLFVCLYLTEAVLGVPLHAMMIRITRQNPIVYALVLVLEALLVCFANILAINAISRRLRLQ